MKKIKVLLLTDEAWNDHIYPNNNMTNWFTDFENIEIAHVYCSEGEPLNKCCNYYFQVTDKMMFKSIIGKNKAGNIIDISFKGNNNTESNSINKSFFYTIVKKISGTHSEFLKLIRDFLWLLGRYDVEKLEMFINDFKPDIIFTQRVGTVKLCRLERLLRKISGCPIIAFTGDNEYSLKIINFSPFFWIRRFMVRNAINKTAKYYSMYYTSSREQALEYAKKFKIPTSLMFKSGVPNYEKIHNKVNKPIRLVYAGKLYCGRWKTLALLVDAIKEVNINGTKLVLDIYTRDKLTKKQKKLLNDKKNVFYKGGATPDELLKVYDNSDIVLHVESLDPINRLITQHSFSTKVIDCLSSGCAVMVIGWEKHSACIELKNSDSAFVMTNKEEVFETIRKIAEDNDLIKIYSNNAMNEIKVNHSRKDIQKKMYGDFLKVLDEGRK